MLLSKGRILVKLDRGVHVHHFPLFVVVVVVVVVVVEVFIVVGYFRERIDFY